MAPTAAGTMAAAAAMIPCLNNGVALVASDTTYPPFESVDTKTNAIVGFDVDLMAAIGKSQGFTPKFVTENFDTIFTKLAQGNYDMVMSAVTITADRAKTVNFTNPYYPSGQSITVRSADKAKYSGVTDLAGAKIGVQKGTTGEDYANNTVKNATVKSYDTAPEAMQALANKDVDVVIIDTPVALNIVATQPTLNLVVTKGDLTDEKYGIAVRKDCADLLNKVNAGLRATIADGTYNTIYRQYFGEDAPAAFAKGGTGITADAAAAATMSATMLATMAPTMASTLSTTAAATMAPTMAATK